MISDLIERKASIELENLRHFIFVLAKVYDFQIGPLALSWDSPVLRSYLLALDGVWVVEIRKDRRQAIYTTQNFVERQRKAKSKESAELWEVILWAHKWRT